jgi:hypothetical protein
MAHKASLKWRVASRGKNKGRIAATYRGKIIQTFKWFGDFEAFRQGWEEGERTAEAAARTRRLIVRSGRLELGDYEAERLTRADGADFSGWIVRSKTNPSDYSDPLPNKRRAIEVLRHCVDQARKDC